MLRTSKRPDHQAFTGKLCRVRGTEKKRDLCRKVAATTVSRSPRSDLAAAGTLGPAPGCAPLTFSTLGVPSAGRGSDLPVGRASPRSARAPAAAADTWEPALGGITKSSPEENP